MRLLDAEALIYDDVAELVDFTDESSAPPYAILSHTWEQEEVLFADIPLGPQHEIAPSLATARAQKRRPAESPDIADSSDNTGGEDTDAEEFYAKHFSPSVSNSKSKSTRKESSSSIDSVNNTGGSGNAYARKTDSRPISPHVKAGWNKILNACLQTLRDGLSYIWIDTCCIDKSSSAELSEAINSMYRWYEHAFMCYAYLSDCPWSRNFYEARAFYQNGDQGTPVVSKDKSSTILRCMESCRWFTRGWTLQELIAPRAVYFFDRQWHSFAIRDNVADILEEITGIDSGILHARPLFSRSKDSYSTAQRMFWASKRKTTRKEDEAYCLLGLFGINMPLLYGEGSMSISAVAGRDYQNVY